MFGQAFVLTILLGFFFWVIGFIEIIALHLFTKPFFGIGIPIYKTKFKLDKWAWFKRPFGIIKKNEGKFKFNKDGTVCFISKFFLGKLFRMSTPFPFKAVGTLKPNGEVEIKARIPIGSTLFFTCWLIGCTLVALEYNVESDNSNSIWFGLAGWGFAMFLVGISYPLEKARMDLMVAEFKEIITAHNNGYNSAFPMCKPKTLILKNGWIPNLENPSGFTKPKS